jgi:hypothetical protein
MIVNGQYKKNMKMSSSTPVVVDALSPLLVPGVLRNIEPVSPPSLRCQNPLLPPESRNVVGIFHLVLEEAVGRVREKKGPAVGIYALT